MVVSFFVVVEMENGPNTGAIKYVASDLSVWELNTEKERERRMKRLAARQQANELFCPSLCRRRHRLTHTLN